MLYKYNYHVTINNVILIYLCQSFIICIYFMKFDCFELSDTAISSHKQLNIPCDSKIAGGGCKLRESYCSLNICICRPEFPINIDDFMCVQRHKNVGESCIRDKECQSNAFCRTNGGKSKTCECRQGFVYLHKNKTCIKGHKDAHCASDNDCDITSYICLDAKCQCKLGFGWNQNEEKCYKKSKNGERCDSTLNCWAYDHFSECDANEKICICTKSLTKRYALGQLTKMCEECPIERYENETDTCKPKTYLVSYVSSRYSTQYIYFVLSITPLIVFSSIGFFYKYVRTTNNMRQLQYIINQHYDQTDIRRVFSIDSTCQNGNINTEIQRNTRSILSERIDDQTSCQTQSTTVSLPFEPPPTYDESQLVVEMPPSYDEAIKSNVLVLPSCNSNNQL